MQFRDDRPNVHVSLQVIGPDGKIILDKPDNIVISDSYPYHPPAFFEKISSWISLPSNPVRGSYVYKYAMTDLISNSSTNYEAKFEVP